jgi:hypothetical protein
MARTSPLHGFSLPLALALVALPQTARALPATRPAGAAPGAPKAPLASSEKRRPRGWLDRVARTRARQPHWITPLVTVTPLLEQEFRFDFLRQTAAPGATTVSYGGGKGLELIPAERVEVILGLPPYITHTRPGPQDGLGDANFLLKYRLLAANESNGDYILTAFFGVRAPTATNGNGSGHTILSPTLAFGKGWGAFDLQTTLGVALPSGAVDRLGTPVAWNAALQYRVLRKLWPELEINSTFWPNGREEGEKEVFLTPGLVVGKLPIHHRLGLTVGTGIQIAATSFHRYAHAWIVSVRLPF